MNYGPMCHVRELLQNDASPWEYILKTRETHFVDECALISYRVLHSLPDDEKKTMNQWLTAEWFYDAVH